MSDLTEDQIQQLVDLGIIDDQMGGLDKQDVMAQKLRLGPSPQGRAQSGVYTAANPLEIVADTVQKYQGQKQLNENKAKRDDLLKKQSLGRALMLQKLLAGQQQPQSMGDNVPEF